MSIEPQFLRRLRVYGGAQGIWVDKVVTAPVASTAGSVCVSILHTGRHYPDDLSDDGVIYHYPETGRQPGRDAAEVEATKEAARLRLPIFVILPSASPSRREVRLGWVTEWDDENKQFLILFGELSRSPNRFQQRAHHSRSLKRNGEASRRQPSAPVNRGSGLRSCCSTEPNAQYAMWPNRS